MSRESKYVIIGGGIAGVSAAEAVHAQDPEGKIVLISKEEESPYSRMALTRFMAGEVKREKLPLHQQDWYAEDNVDLILGAAVESIDRENRNVRLADGRSFAYDKLVLASGASPFIPPFPGKDLQGVMALRTLADAEYVLDCCCEPIQVVVIGGGLLGLEMAGAISRTGAKVTIIETFDWLLPRQLDPPGGNLLQARIEAMGMSVITGGKTKGMLADENGKVRAVQMEDGTELPADLVLVSTGVRPNLELAKAAGLEANKGLLVDDRMATSDPHIFAAGDLTEHKGVLYGLWQPAKTQGDVAGTNAAGGQAAFEGVPPSAMLKVLGIDLFSIGQIAANDAADKVMAKEVDGNYSSYTLRDGKLIGAILFGEAGLSGKVKKAMDAERAFSAEESASLESLEAALRA